MPPRSYRSPSSAFRLLGWPITASSCLAAPTDLPSAHPGPLSYRPPRQGLLIILRQPEAPASMPYTSQHDPGFMPTYIPAYPPLARLSAGAASVPSVEPGLSGYSTDAPTTVTISTGHMKDKEGRPLVDVTVRELGEGQKLRRQLRPRHSAFSRACCRTPCSSVIYSCTTVHRRCRRDRPIPRYVAIRASPRTLAEASRPAGTAQSRTLSAQTHNNSRLTPQVSTSGNGGTAWPVARLHSCRSARVVHDDLAVRSSALALSQPSLLYSPSAAK